MGKSQCCDKVGIKRGRWTKEEDEILRKYIQANGKGCWRSLPKNAGLLRCGKSCRLRWINYLRSDLKRGNISAEEEDTIVNLQASLGNRWSLIAAHLPGRTDNEIKNYWNSHLSKTIHLRQPDPHSIQPLAATTAKTYKRTGRRSRIGRLATKNNENIPEPSDTQNGANSNSNSNRVTVPEPMTPTTEKEVLSSTIPRIENNGHVIVPDSSVEEVGCEEMAVDEMLCMDDIIVDGGSGTEWSSDKEAGERSVDKRECEETAYENCGDRKLGSSDYRECSRVMECPGNLWEDWDAAVGGIANGGWGREENTLSWLWDDSTMDKEA